MNTLYVVYKTFTSRYRGEILGFISLISITSGISMIISKNRIVSILFLIGLLFAIATYLLIHPVVLYDYIYAWFNKGRGSPLERDEKVCPALNHMQAISQTSASLLNALLNLSTSWPINIPAWEGKATETRKNSARRHGGGTDH